ncbi:MAG: peptide methionine sulfoxide reductase msrA [Gemmatimonadetes bacterium]|nr:peptide methionine sulfoxide reductase msrA [Gemmatimonadota bacterium]
MSTEVATLGGGCFWCLEAAFRELPGILSVTSGYAGGHVEKPSYRAVCDGATGHVEVVQVEFDNEQLAYRTLLEAMFAIHDPTTRDRQGNDVGPQYRSVIMYHTAEQERTARDLIAELDRDETFGAPIVTDVLPAPKFWPAEDYHQEYFARNGGQPYCQFIVAPKVAKLRKAFARG